MIVIPFFVGNNFSCDAVIVGLKNFYLRVKCIYDFQILKFWIIDY